MNTFIRIYCVGKGYVEKWIWEEGLYFTDKKESAGYFRKQPEGQFIIEQLTERGFDVFTAPIERDVIKR